METPMAPDERDRNFDKALSRHLRSVASPGVSANLPSGPAAPTVSCLDSETLAAYHERSLLPEEMNSCKDHIVGCAHCQAILAQLEATDSILLPVENKEVPIMDFAGPVAAAARDRAAAQPALPHKAPFPRSIRAPRWRWLAPAGALAAGLLVWVAWHEEKPQLPGSSEVKTARVPEPSPPASPVTRQAPASSSSDQFASDQFAELSKARGAIGGLESSKVLNESGSLKHQGRFDSGTRGAPAKPSAEKENALREDADRYSSPALLRDENRLALDAKDAEAAPTKKLEMQNQAANIQSQNQVISPKVPGPSPLGQAGQTAKAKSESSARDYRSATAPPPQPAPALAFSDAASIELGAVTSPHLITAPNKKNLWRVGHAGLIEFSSDTGASWSRQTSNVLVDLTSGSALSDKVCWVVGRAGTILLTTDGGENWSIIHAPIEEDLEGVHAWDSRHAVVFANRGFEAYETKDGGKTWKRWISEE
jgi:hypothetical protein